MGWDGMGWWGGGEVLGLGKVDGEGKGRVRWGRVR